MITKKRIVTALATLAIFLSAQGAVDFPVAFYPDLASPSVKSDWTFRGPEGRPSGNYGQLWFPQYSADNPVAVRVSGGYTTLWTTSEYTPSTESDTWIITPEIQLPDTPLLLNFILNVLGINDSYSETVKVMISTNGTEPEDFTELGEFTLKGSATIVSNGQVLETGSSILNTRRQFVSLEDYTAQTVRLAFVNQGNFKGVVGFSDINIVPWYVDYSSFKGYDDKYVNPQLKEIDFNLPIKVSFPVKIDNLLYSFETPYGFSYEGNNDISATEPCETSTVQINVKGIPLTEEYVPFNLTVTPDYDGLTPLKLSGLYYNTQPQYDMIPVLEEATGMWCGWCPFGAAALDFYTDKYNGKDGNSLIIPIAAHQGDVLQVNASFNDYQKSFEDLLSVSSYPSVYFNRKSSVGPSPDPRTVGRSIESLLSTKAYANVNITGVEYDDDAKEGKVNFVLESALDPNYLPLNVSVVVVEDEVRGTNSTYDQNSYLKSNGYTRDYLVSMLGEEWEPYFEPYYNSSLGRFNNVVYQSVARASYPEFSGVMADISASNTPTELSLEFEIPETVMNPENVRLVVLATNSFRGEIYGAAQAGLFSGGSSRVNTALAGNDFKVSVKNGNLIVSSSENAEVSVFTPSGLPLARFSHASGETSYAIPNATSVILVKINSGATSEWFKFLVP